MTVLELWHTALSPLNIFLLLDYDLSGHYIKVNVCDFISSPRLTTIIGPSLPTTTLNVPAPRHLASTHCNTYTPPFIRSYNSSYMSSVSPILLPPPPTTMPSSFVLSAQTISSRGVPSPLHKVLSRQPSTLFSDQPIAQLRIHLRHPDRTPLHNRG